MASASLEPEVITGYDWSWKFPPYDPRSTGWPLVGSIYPLVVMLGFYVYTVKKAIPEYMANRKPYNIQRIVQLYNVFQIVSCVIFLWKFIDLAYLKNGYSPFYPETDLSTRPATLELVTVFWYYYLLRVVEFLETVFFCLRKNFRQVSGLHVFHHCVVAWNMYLCLTYGAQAQVVFVACANTCVHIVMYTYYFLSSLSPVLRPYLWWKKYITQIQLIQFIAIFLYNLCPFIFHRKPFVKPFAAILLSEAVIFLVLFSMFYVDSYLKNRLRNNALKTCNGDGLHHKTEIITSATVSGFTSKPILPECDADAKPKQL